MMHKWNSFLLCAGIAALLAGCTDAPPVVQVPLLSFDQYKPILLNVARIDVIDKFRVADAPSSLKHVELLMKQPPEQALQELVKKQLVAAGPSRVMRVIIEDASVTGEKLPVTEGFAGLFQNEPSERYHATIALRFEIAENDAPDIVIGNARVTADRTQTVMKDASPAQRDMAFFHLDEQLMADVSHGLQTVVRSSFGLQ